VLRARGTSTVSWCVPVPVCWDFLQELPQGLQGRFRFEFREKESFFGFFEFSNFWYR